jgi:hypothetical protein
MVAGEGHALRGYVAFDHNLDERTVNSRIERGLSSAERSFLVQGDTSLVQPDTFRGFAWDIGVRFGDQGIIVQAA